MSRSTEWAWLSLSHPIGRKVLCNRIAWAIPILQVNRSVQGCLLRYYHELCLHQTQIYWIYICNSILIVCCLFFLFWNLYKDKQKSHYINLDIITRGGSAIWFSYSIGKLLLKATTTIYNVRVVLVCIVVTLLFLTHSSQKHSSVAVMTLYLQLREQDHCDRVLRHMC